MMMSNWQMESGKHMWFTLDLSFVMFMGIWCSGLACLISTAANRVRIPGGVVNFHNAFHYTI